MNPLDLAIWALVGLVVIASAVFAVVIIVSLFRFLAKRNPAESRDVYRGGDSA